MKIGNAKLLCYSEYNQRLQAFGWIQTWKPFRHKFGRLAKDGVMLGPYWTEPHNRGRGLYGKLLSKNRF